MEATIIDEWTDDREDGPLGFRLVQDETGGMWLEMRSGETIDGKDYWDDWFEEDLDGPGCDVLVRLPTLLEAERAAERARIRKELKAAIFEVFQGLVSEANPAMLHPIEGGVMRAIDRILPEGE